MDELIFNSWVVSCVKVNVSQSSMHIQTHTYVKDCYQNDRWSILQKWRKSSSWRRKSCQLSSHLFGLLYTTLLLLETNLTPQLKHLLSLPSFCLIFHSYLPHLAQHPSRLLGTWDTRTLGPKIAQSSSGPHPNGAHPGMRSCPKGGALLVFRLPGFPETSSSSQSSSQSVFCLVLISRTHS